MKGMSSLTGKYHLLEYVIHRAESGFLKASCKHTITCDIGRSCFQIKSDRQELTFVCLWMSKFPPSKDRKYTWVKKGAGACPLKWMTFCLRVRPFTLTTIHQVLLLPGLGCQGIRPPLILQRTILAFSWLVCFLFCGL